jgi:hypothetical protein
VSAQERGLHLVEDRLQPGRVAAPHLGQRLRGVLGDRPKAVAAVTRILLDEIETLLCLERLRCAQQATPTAASPASAT